MVALDTPLRTRRDANATLVRLRMDVLWYRSVMLITTCTTTVTEKLETSLDVLVGRV